MMTQQPPRAGGAPRLRPAHRALVVESCAAVVLGAWLLSLTPFPLVLAVVVITGCAAGAAVLAAVLTSSPGMAAAMAAWAPALCGWLTWERAAGQPYSAAGITGLGAAGGGVTLLTLVMYAGLHDDRKAAAAHAAAAAAAARLGRWASVLAGLGVEGVTARREDETRAGRDVTLAMPASGKVTIRSVRMVADGVAAALRLPEGSVYFTEGRHAAEVIMHLDEHDALAGDLPMPADTSLLTVAEPLVIGATGDGEPAAARFREVSCLVTGVTGAGKTNLMNVLIALLTRCPDVVVFVIDLKGGRLAAPWLMPWIEGDSPRPAIDWVATTREEAWLMLCALDDLITARGGSLVGGSKIPPSAAYPLVAVIGDEIADIFGQQGRREAGQVANADMVEKGSAVTRKGRSEAVMAVWGTQRPTNTMLGSGDLKSQCKLRFGLGTASEADARATVADSAAASRMIARLAHPGTGIVWLPGAGQPVPVKFWRLDAADDADAAKLRKLAAAAGSHRPALEPLALEAMGDRYTRRWERSGLYQQLAAASPAAAELASEPAPELPQAAVADTFRAMLEAEGLAGGKPDPRGRMYAILAGHPVWGLSVMEIVSRLDRESLGVRRETVYRWLREDQAAAPPRVVKSGDGQGARYLLPGGPGE
jgi:hypothetical protein